MALFDYLSCQVYFKWLLSLNHTDPGESNFCPLLIDKIFNNQYGPVLTDHDGSQLQTTIWPYWGIKLLHFFFPSLQVVFIFIYNRIGGFIPPPLGTVGISGSMESLQWSQTHSAPATALEARWPSPVPAPPAATSAPPHPWVRINDSRALGTGRRRETTHEEGLLLFFYLEVVNMVHHIT